MPASYDTGSSLTQRAVFSVSGLSSSASPINSNFHAAEALLGVVLPVGGMFFNFDTSWSSHQAEVDDFANQSRTLHICWQPKTSGTVLFSDILSGAYDAHIDQMLAGMAAYPYQVVCRFAHEMNGNWYPWNMAYNGADKGVTSLTEYKNVWQYIVNKARSDAPDVKWLYCVNGSDVGSYTLEEYYPGDSYVDLIGFDAYNNYAADPVAGWTSPYDLYQPVYDRLDVLNTTADMWIGETGCMDGVAGRSKAEWLQELFAETRLSRLKVVNYFDTVGGKDWRFETSLASSQAAAVGYQSVVGAVPYSETPGPTLTIPGGTVYMVQLNGEDQPRFLINKQGKIHLGDGTNELDTFLNRAGAGVFGTKAFRLENQSSTPSQLSSGPILFGQNGAVKINPSSGSAVTIKRNLLDVYSLKAITMDPIMATSSGSLNGGVMYLARVHIDEAVALNGVAIYIATAGSGLLGSNFAGLYSSGGTLVAKSDDQSSAWMSNGYKEVVFETPYNCEVGDYYVAILANGSVLPALARGQTAGGSGFIHNFGLSGASSRFGSYGSSLIALPSSITVGSISNSPSLSLLAAVY